MINVITKIKKAVKDPRLAVAYLLRRKYAWEQDQKHANVKKIQYRNYNDYLVHQKSKLHIYKDCYLPEYDQKYREILRQRLIRHGIVRQGAAVLCLAARIGTEVKSFIDLGCFAIGLDINPGEKNRYVVYGDFHDIQFSDGSIDVIFTNSLDHVYDFE